MELKFLLDVILKSKIHLKGTVKELIWNYTDQLLKDLHGLKPDLLPSQYYHIQVRLYSVHIVWWYRPVCKGEGGLLDSYKASFWGLRSIKLRI